MAWNPIQNEQPNTANPAERSYLRDYLCWALLSSKRLEDQAWLWDVPMDELLREARLILGRRSHKRSYLENMQATAIRNDHDKAD